MGGIEATHDEFDRRVQAVLEILAGATVPDVAARALGSMPAGPWW